MVKTEKGNIYYCPVIGGEMVSNFIEHAEKLLYKF